MVTESVLISFNVFFGVYSPIHNVVKIIQKSFLAVSVLAVLPTIRDLAEASELSMLKP